ncbi:hypothetical protein [Aquisalinus flavus]|uniref:YaiO family outer membrane beta-barrel protein n=1 Tax=Aquisalinus flavus TaxID=1526572 RepID=A0A8J2Y851_9PROT|nr:hypothetical protein [Aquisalinus flavus]MBD0425725.1 hypothetical protein [Aquisalinus flavus]UNE48665.1 hypothetical protein FF099_11700 [Aquisalinus flavus]GGD13767.1 hypothetical protein GCM10011342_23170 [Aquisalinus flavus]
MSWGACFRQFGLVTLAAMLAAYPCLASASAWTRPSGEVLLINRGEYFRGNHRASHYEQIATSLYLEAGLSDVLMLGGTLFYADQVNDGEFAGASSGIATAEAFLQARFHRTGTSVVSGSLLYSAETNISRVLAAGTGELVEQDAGLEAALHYGRDIGPVFVSAKAGYRTSLGLDPERLNTELVIGWKPDEHWMLMVKSLNTTSLTDGNRPLSDYDIYRLEPVIAWTPKGQTTYEIGVRSDVEGRNTATGTAAFFGIWSRF